MKYFKQFGCFKIQREGKVLRVVKLLLIAFIAECEHKLGDFFEGQVNPSSGKCGTANLSV